MLAWVNELRSWDTLFELQAEHPRLGLRGDLYFSTDYVLDLAAGTYRHVITYPAFSGYSVGKGISAFAVTDAELETYFQPVAKTLRELEQEYVAGLSVGTD